VTASSASNPGTLRSGRYAIVGELGSGSQADTLDAIDKLNGRAVAIKRFQVRGAKSWKDVELAEREARVLSTLSHANLPVYVEHFEEEGALYLVMEKIEGETLASIRRRREGLDQAEVARFLADAASVLSYLHSRVPAIIHRDIKPGNVIRRRDGSFAFVDFGSVRDQLKPEGGSTVVGTFGYMAPEQFQGRALPASDVYAVGATALALVTGREPEDLPHRGLAIDVRAALGVGAEPWLVRVLSSMLDPDPDKRAARVPTTGSGRRSAGSAAPAPAPGSSDDWRELRDRGREQRRQLREESERLRREIKDQVRNQTRRVRRGSDWHAPRSGFYPAPLLMFVAVLALTAARLAAFAAFRVLMPSLLLLLSLPFGGELRRWARACQQVGVETDRGLRRTLDAVRGRMREPEGAVQDRESDDFTPEPAKTRVQSPPRRVQVDLEPDMDAYREPEQRERREQR